MIEDGPALLVVLDEAVHPLGVDDHVGEDAVEPCLELGAEAAHDRVDDDESRHAEHDADDADERQVPVWRYRTQSSNLYTGCSSLSRPASGGPGTANVAARTRVRVLCRVVTTSGNRKRGSGGVAS